MAMITTTSLSLALGRTVRRKEGGEVPEKTPISRTLTSRPKVRNSLFPHTLPYREMDTKLATNTMDGVVKADPSPPPESKG